MDKRIIGVYETGEEAIKAVESLQAQGYNREDISVVAKDKEELNAVNEETGTKVEEGLAAGAATGGIWAVLPDYWQVWVRWRFRESDRYWQLDRLLQH